MKWVVELQSAEVECPVEHEGAWRRAMALVGAMCAEVQDVDRDRADCVPGGVGVHLVDVPDQCDSG
jgi:hypothetical protein